MQFDPPTVPPVSQELVQVRADAARHARELDMVRAELAILQPGAWRSPAARAFADSVTDVADSLARVRSTLDEGLQALGTQL